MKTPLSEREYSQAITGRFNRAMQHLLETRAIRFRADACRATRLSNDHLSRIERNERALGMEPACRFCLAYNISPTWLLLGKVNILWQPLLCVERAFKFAAYHHGLRFKP